jgi:hypothetical protein
MPDNPLTDADYKKINATMHDQFKINHVTLQVESGQSEDDACKRTNTC